MTDNRTNEPTAEQIVRATLLRCQFDTLGDKVADVVKDLRANGLLSEGAPSEKQARAIRKLDNVQAILAGAQASVTDTVRELSLTSAALTAAGVASQEVIDDAADEQDDLRMHMFAPQPVFDEAALAEVIGYAYNSEHHDPATHAARAVAEWLKGQGGESSGE